jgi:hypothetical protein
MKSPFEMLCFARSTVMILFLIVSFSSVPSHAQSSLCTATAVQFTQGNLKPSYVVSSNCEYSIPSGFASGTYSAQTHLLTQPTIATSASKSVATNAAGQVRGCIVPSTAAGNTWDIVPNGLNCAAPAPKPKLKLEILNPNASAFAVDKNGISYAVNEYILKIEVLDAATTAPISIDLVLPVGIKTNGSINAFFNAQPSLISGCPSSGSINLNGCQLPSGAAKGIHRVQVRLAIDSSATTGTVSANISSVGATCSITGGTVCGASSPSIGILDAVNDSVSQIVGSNASFNVAANDKVPTGSHYSVSAVGGSCLNSTITTQGNASYKVPATVGQSCTLNYVLKHILNSQMTGTLTVQAVPAPVIALSKSVSQNPLVIGKAGQFYRLRVEVQQHETTAPLLISDTLPTGITVAGAITSSGGTLSGCPTSGSNLTGCALASALPVGVYEFTVPISVDAAATAGNNTASISSLGATCLGTANAVCTASTGNVGVLNAVDETVTLTTSTQVTSNVASNDTVPTGAQYSIAPRSTCSGVSITTAGIASFTAPAAGQSCTVRYQLCSAGARAVCENATLTVISPMTLTVTTSGLAAGATVILQNNGADNLTVTANGSSTFNSPITGSYAVTVYTQPSSGQCTVANGAGTATGSTSNVVVTCVASRFAYVAKAGGGNYALTECVKDTVTGLIWEGKTASGDRAGSNTYTNYHDQYLGTTAQMNDSTNTYGYVNAVNRLSLCGGNWRMPDKDELSALYFAAPIGSNNYNDWLPNTPAWIYWSSSPFAGYSNYALSVFFNNGTVLNYPRVNINRVRLVH